MRWVVPAVVGGFALFCGLVFLLGLRVQRHSTALSGAYSAYPAGYYGSGPDWERLAAAEQKGASGLTDVQALMLSSDDQVASQAARSLAQKPGQGRRLFFEQFANVNPAVKTNIGSDYFTAEMFDDAVEAAKGPAGPSRDGAMLFLNASYMRNNDSSIATRTLKGLAEAVPKADDKLRTDLAYTLSLYALHDLGPLVKLLGHDDAAVRKTAVVALGKTGRADALTLVQGVLDDSDAGVRKAAQQAEKSLNAAMMAAAAAVASRPGDPAALAAEQQNGRNRLGMP